MTVIWQAVAQTGPVLCIYITQVAQNGPQKELRAPLLATKWPAPGQNSPHLGEFFFFFFSLIVTFSYSASLVLLVGVLGPVTLPKTSLQIGLLYFVYFCVLGVFL
jgi:hypothetical protein